MNFQDAHELLERAKGGESLTSDELAAIRAELRAPGSDSDVHSLLRALAMSARPTQEDIDLAKKIVQEGADDWWMQGAIYALCVHWDRCSDVIEELIALTSDHRWSEHSNSAISAFSVLGDQLMKKQEPWLYNHFLKVVASDERIFEETPAKFNSTHLQCAFDALDRGIRGDEALLSPFKVKSPRDMPPAILAAATRRGRLH